ncbi:PilC/PilY family type IV pilus protein [Acinetobacter sp. NBRC 110496]|uniref:PilC/PilY family type IV pilus protein n=1 Tax=Acinetobacter sp. NBRC 110496 TaxID=1550715 RepID=UPI0005C7A2A3|nr:PilC/PilY family type IV pilus protein [Acinetobacter sp. NBRC 110496]
MTKLEKFQRNKLWYVICSSSLTMSWLMMASVVEASDLQIYAVPTAGKKTIVMMLDTSGSMGPNLGSGYSLYDDYGLTSRTCSVTSTTSSTTPSYSRNYCVVASNTTNARVTNTDTGCEKQSDNSYRCYDRLTRLKDGMFTFLNSTNPVLNSVSVGLGHFSGYNVGTTTGDNNSGEILVTAADLGAVGSSQRVALKTAVARLEASGGTPTSNAFAEAAAYLLGTSTRTFVDINKDIYKKVTTISQVFDHYECQNTAYPNLNPMDNRCYQYQGFSGRTLAATVTNNYSCTDPSYPYLNGSKCYRNSTSTKSINATNNPTYSCTSSSYPYLNPANNTCYQSNSGYSGGTVTPTTITRPVSTDQYYQCTSWATTDFTNQYQQCNGRTGTNSSYWQNLGSTAPDDLALDGSVDVVTNPVHTVYYRVVQQAGANAYSGFDKSIRASKNADETAYISPLPAVENRQSCDGQGVYILSDGAPSSNPDSGVLAAALGRNSFSNSGGLSGGASDWAYMSNFARALYNGGTIQSNASNATNPANVSIQTAFVGFGAALNALSTNDAINACKMSSRTQGDRSGDDACSPNQTTNAIAAPGYGNGGFFPTIDANGVTQSVIAFINNLGNVPLDPLTTGQISVPYDALNPNNLSQYGYLRALEPDPAHSYLTWRGNLKRYSATLTGTNIGAFRGNSGGLVYDAAGAFNTGTKDYWNSSSYTDGGKVFLGGAYSKTPLPYNGQTEVSSGGIISRYAYSASQKLRNLFTDVSAVDTTTAKLTAATGSTTGTALLKIPESATSPFANVTAVGTHVLSKFNPSTGQDILKDFPVAIKLKLLNYLGYSTDITADTLPTSLAAPDAPYLSMGGSIHSIPVQLTYSGTLDSQGNLTNARSQSILYGSMEGGLRLVDASSGEEQMVFVPAAILNDSTKSKALVVGQTDLNGPTHGMDGSWVADPTYNITSTTSGSSTTSSVTARQMNVYGGMRMGGSSYYALNLLTPTNPKLLFRIDNSTSGFERLGQTWSKPVLANVRYNNVITRVMIVGGGYDECYENPTFSLASTGDDSTCSTRTKAKGNAVYMINAKTGALIWSATYSADATDDQRYMKHSIVSRISTLDRDADGLVDHLYFGDLGGQVFRADFNNIAGTSTSNFGKRVVRLANLATNDTTNDASNDYTGAKAPRFYVQPTVTIHDQGANTFIVVGIASGDRSTPLDVYPIQGREGMSPANALSGQPVNNVYGILDHDFIKADLITGTPTLVTQNKTRIDLKKNPQILATGETVAAFFFPTSGTGKFGWYRSLSSKSSTTTAIDSVEKADGSFRIRGGLKAFEEEPVAITNNLLVPVYDPQGTGIAQQDPCKPRVIGETDWQRYCLPFGACIKTDGTLNTALEAKSGFQTKTTGCPAGVTECNDNVIGGGIRGITFVPKPDTSNGSCGKLTMAGNTQGTGEWQCTSRLIQTRWYERYRQ